MATDRAGWTHAVREEHTVLGSLAVVVVLSGVFIFGWVPALAPQAWPTVLLEAPVLSDRSLELPIPREWSLVFVGFPTIYGVFWGAACGAFDTWLVCSGFLQRGFTSGILIGITAPTVGAYLVNRQMALIGEALAHTAFGGVAIGLFVGAAAPQFDYPLAFALVVATIAALAMQYIAVRTEGYADIPIAIMLTGGFAVGIAVISYGVTFSTAVESYLFGDILFVPFENVQLMVGLTLVVGAMIALTHKQLLFITFDREAARLARINVWFYDTLLIVLTALVVVAAMQILGAILVAGMLVIPVAAAMQLTNSFNRGMVLSVLLGQVAVFGGIFLSYTWDVATGAMIIIVAIALYVLALIVR